MFCAKCGKEIDNNSKFCPFCGQKVGEPVVNKRNISFSIPFHISAKKVVPVAIIFVILLFIIGKLSGSGSSDYERALKAYIKYADSMDREASYYLVDIDHDSVPECLVWDYAGNGSLDHIRVLGYKKRKIVEVSGLSYTKTVSSIDNIQDGTVLWDSDGDYFVIYSNNQDWYEEMCIEQIYKIDSSGINKYHTIIKRKSNSDAYWSYDVDGTGISAEAERKAGNI